MHKEDSILNRLTKEKNVRAHVKAKQNSRLEESVPWLVICVCVERYKREREKEGGGIREGESSESESENRWGLHNATATMVM